MGHRGNDEQKRNRSEPRPAAAMNCLRHPRFSVPFPIGPRCYNDKNESFKTERPYYNILRRLNQAVGGPFERSDVDTLHLHHRLEGALGAGRIGVAEKGRKLARHDLPG